MQRKILALFTPPIAVCRYGCASCCVAPIFVFWLASIGSVIYAFFGGPSGMEGFSWGTFALGIILWAIAVSWAETVIKGVADDLETPKCSGKSRQPFLHQPDFQLLPFYKRHFKQSTNRRLSRFGSL